MLLGKYRRHKPLMQQYIPAGFPDMTRDKCAQQGLIQACNTHMQPMLTLRPAREPEVAVPAVKMCPIRPLQGWQDVNLFFTLVSMRTGKKLCAVLTTSPGEYMMAHQHSVHTTPTLLSCGGFHSNTSAV